MRSPLLIRAEGWNSGDPADGPITLVHRTPVSDPIGYRSGLTHLNAQGSGPLTLP